jgi:hypothetical protein
MKLIIPLALLIGCVVPYGEAPETTAVSTAPPVSTIGTLTSLEARLLLLMDENQDADRAARLEALRSLLRHSRTWTPDAQQDLVVYLHSLLAVEERWRSEAGMEGFEPVAPSGVAPEELDGLGGVPVAVPILEERLGDEPEPGLSGGAGPEPEPGPESDSVTEPEESGDSGEPQTVTPDRDPAARRREGLARAREALSREDYLEAITELDALLEAREASGAAEPDRALVELRSEAVDGWVFLERERAGRLFLDARGLTDRQARERGLEEVATILEGLLKDYPDCRYSEAIHRNLQLVQDELQGE